MPDSQSNFDPLDQVMTPMQLAALRYQMQQQQFQQAAQSMGGNGRNFGAMTAGLSAGRMIGNSGPPGSDPMSQFAQQNQDVLNQTPMPGAGTPQPGGGNQPGMSPTQLLMAQAAVWDQRAQAFSRSQPQAAEMMSAKANQLRQQAQALLLSQAQAGEAQAHGALYGQEVQQGPTKLALSMQQSAIDQAKLPIEQEANRIRAIEAATAQQQMAIAGYKAAGMDDLRDAALAAQQGIQQTDMARGILRKSPPGVVGPQAAVVQKVNALLTAVGVKPSGDLLTDQATLNSALASAALGNRPKGMTRLTNFDLEFLQKIGGHPENLDVPAVMAILNQRENVMRKAISQYNAQAEPWAARGGIMTTLANPIAAPTTSGGWLRRRPVLAGPAKGQFQYQFPAGIPDSLDPHADQLAQ